MIDRLRIGSLIDRIDTELALLRRVRAAGDPVADELTVRAVKYSLVVVVEAAIDVARHIIAARRYRRPLDYADSFTVLAERDIVDVGLAERLRAMARFRNLLVHGYATVDDRRVAEILDSDLADVDRFVAAIATVAAQPDEERGPTGG